MIGEVSGSDPLLPWLPLSRSHKICAFYAAKSAAPQSLQLFLARELAQTSMCYSGP